MFKKSKRRAVRYGIVSANLLLLAGMVVFVISDYSNASGGSNTSQALAGSAEETVNPLDQLSSVDVAVHVARLTQLDEATSVVNKADTTNAQQAVTPADDQVIAKPQVISTDLKSKKDIQTYISREGDTVSTVADKFGLTPDTIRYSNNLETEVITAGTKLLISPINGIVYKVQVGDTPESIATKYRASKEQLVAFNDAELTGKFKAGELIIIPDGVRPTPALTSALTTGSESFGFSFGGGGPVYSGNGYDYGYCTYWAALRRAQIGNPIPSNLGNASTWRTLASAAGFPVGNTPREGAVIWFPPSDYYGHVAFVERVNPDGSVEISEMNYAGWNRVSYRTFSASEAKNYSYIY